MLRKGFGRSMGSSTRQQTSGDGRWALPFQVCGPCDGRMTQDGCEFVETTPSTTAGTPLHPSPQSRTMAAARSPRRSIRPGAGSNGTTGGSGIDQPLDRGRGRAGARLIPAPQIGPQRPAHLPIPGFTARPPRHATARSARRLGVPPALHPPRRPQSPRACEGGSADCAHNRRCDSRSLQQLWGALPVVRGHLSTNRTGIKLMIAALSIPATCLGGALVMDLPKSRPRSRPETPAG